LVRVIGNGKKALQIFYMHFTLMKEVVNSCLSFGVKDVVLKFNESSGPKTEGYIYFFKKPICNLLDVT
jgi:hypothetical protein